MQLILIILTKRKEMIHYCESFGYGGTTLSKIITNDLSMLVYLQKKDESSPSWAFHFIPNMVISLHPQHGHFTQCPTAKHKQPNNLINRKKAPTSPKSSTKATNNKIRSSTTK
jgi:hypothetical protein